MKDFAEAFVPAVAIVFIFGIPGIIIFWNLHNKHKEKMRLICQFEIFNMKILQHDLFQLFYYLLFFY